MHEQLQSELTSPYVFFHSANLSHIGDVGMSSRLPIRGFGIGPGGRGGLDPLILSHFNIAKQTTTMMRV